MHSISIPLLLFALVSQAPTPPATAVDQMTVTGHAEDAPFQALARTVVVITRDEIERLPARSVADLLAYVASVDVRSRGPMGVQSDFSLRGATFGQALVLVDGVRLNDSQSGHHNGDIPVPLDEIDRIEILLGPGSSLYGADAFGGTINVITRRAGAWRRASASAGAFGLVSGQASMAGTLRGVRESFAVSADRSGAFEPDRDFRTIDVSSSTELGRGVHVRASYLGKGFGAAGFYGPAPSTERTNQTLVAFDGDTRTLGAWSGRWQASYRTHGDVFLYDPAAGSMPNRHRTHTVLAGGSMHRALGAHARLTLGTQVGEDWIRSNNLGSHDLAHAGIFAEMQLRAGARTVVYPSVRIDGYSTFGSAVSPGLSAATWMGSRLKVHGALDRAFRVPTFTDRFYSDPSNLGTPTLTPEHAWSGEAGLDLVGGAAWVLGATAFDRRERGTIDFVRASTLEKWQAENIRRVETRGVELTARRALAGRGIVTAGYTYLDADTDPLPLLSKYLLQFARHSAVVGVSTALPGGFSLGQRGSYTRRLDGSAYWLVDTRIGRQVGRATLFLEGTNLLDAHYEEIPGVAMPGRWLQAGVATRW